jgi:pyruvate/2-oxoglutarate dehydrogenase complex dihydrolipoamide acyltransferase (E2) component
MQVSVDVRSPHPGLLKAFHAALNDTVAVGAPLFTLDTDSSAAATAGSGSSSSSSNSSSASSSPGSSSSSSASAHLTPPFNPQEAASSLRSVATQGISDAATITHSPQQHRKPSINFRHGVRAPPSAGSAAGSSSGGARPSGSAAVGDYTASLEAQHPSRKGALPELSVSPSFGRPPINGDQEFLIFSGGAYGAPPPPPPAKAPKK